MVEKRYRLAVARFWYEGNSFSPLLADRLAFERREWLRGQAALDATARESELRAVIEFKAKHPDWDVDVFRCASASPAGQIDDEVFSSFLDETLADLKDQAFDAIYLSLHGAGVTTKREDPEVELLARDPENSADGADRREFRPARQSRQRAGKLPDDGQRLSHLSAHRHARDGVARAERAGADG